MKFAATAMRKAGITPWAIKSGAAALPESRTSADLRRDVEDKSRALETRQGQLLALMKGTRNASGGRDIAPEQAEQIRHLEAQCVILTEQVNALKFDYIQARTEEDLARRSRESLGSASIFDGSGGSRISFDDAFPRGGQAAAAYSLGDAFINTQSYKSWRHGGQGQLADVEVPGLGMREHLIRNATKAVLTTAAGPFTSIDKQPDVVQLGTQVFTVADLFAQAQTNNTTIRYIQEDTLTNVAVEVAEDALKPEATWDLSEVDSIVKKIAMSSKVSDDMFSDYAQIRDYVNDRMPWMVRQREELQLLNGDGVGVNILGVLNVPGILTQALGTNNNVDAIYLGITKVRTQGFWEPDAIVMHPNNWSPIRLLKSTTQEYVYGHPALPGPETLFGKRVVVTANMLANTGLVGAFRIGGTLYYRLGVRVEATNSNEDDFTHNRITLRAEERMAPVYWRPKAFCKVTGLTVLP